jgi:hypothetical protein
VADGAFALYNEPSKAFHGGPGHFYPTYKKKPYRKAVVDYTSADWVDTEYLLRAMLILCEYANIIRIVLQFVPVFGSISDIAFIFITWSRYRILYKEPFYKGGKEKPRVPAWCDRILYRSASRLQGGFVPDQVSGTVTHPAAIDKTATQPPAPTQLSRVCVRACVCVRGCPNIPHTVALRFGYVCQVDLGGTVGLADNYQALNDTMLCSDHSPVHKNTMHPLHSQSHALARRMLVRRNRSLDWFVCCAWCRSTPRSI